MSPARRSAKRAAVKEPAPTYSPRRLLLDTHVWLWWYTGDRRLGREALALIKHSEDVRVSAASAWEIAIKQSIGKLVFKTEVRLELELERDGFLALPVTLAHADEVRRLPALHRDPFDRMLIAQARVDGLTIVSADDAILRYGIPAVDAGV